MLTYKDEIITASQYIKPFWIDWYLDRRSTKYNVISLYRLSADLNKDRLQQALEKLVRSSYHLRSSFFEENGILKQQISSHMDVTLHCYSITTTRESNALIKKHSNYCFNLISGPLFHFVLIKNIIENTFILLLNFHHIIVDGLQLEVMFKQICEYYHNPKFSVGSDIDSIKYHKEYLKWESENLAKLNLAYWLERIKGNPLAVNLPYKKSINDSRTFYPKFHFGKLDHFLYEKLTIFSKEFNFTIFNTLLTCWALLISRYSNHNQISLIYPVSVRPKHLINKIKGAFVNTLLFPYQEAGSFIEQLEQASNNDDKRYNRYFPILKLIENLPGTDINAIQSFFKISFAQTNLRLNKINLTCKSEALSTSDIAHSELVLEYQIINDQLFYRINYLGQLFSSSFIKQLLKHFKELLNQLLQKPLDNTQNIGLLTKKEISEIEIKSNQTDKKLARQTLHGLFEQRIKKTPNKRAVVFEEQQLTYRELNQRADSLARYIHQYYKKYLGKDLVSDTIIAICGEPSIETIIGILGILKSGAAYLPIDPFYPKQQINFMLKEGGIKLLLTNKKDFFLEDGTIHIINLNNFPTNITTEVPVCAPHHLAYVIYTSGSTSKAKGVLIQHDSAVNTITALNKLFCLKPHEKVLQFVSMAFDVFVSELFCCLSSGSCLYIPSKTIKQDLNLLANYITSNQINIIPAMPAAVLENMPSLSVNFLRLIVVGGEKCAKATMDDWAVKTKLINAYGPTETAICASWHQYYPGDSVTNIGKPIHNIKFYVLDYSLNLCPIGASGELYICGIGLARGYLNGSDLIEKNFISNPFVASENGFQDKHLRLYKTGDIVRWLPDGSLEFIDRRDTQIKLRGYRIELSEIETTLQEHAAIQNCVVDFIQEENQKHLIAYYILAKNRRLSAAELSNYLSGRLPKFMIPSSFIEIKSIPLTANGKINRQVLFKSCSHLLKSKLLITSNKLENKLLKIWQDLLKVNLTCTNENFFNLGGHSLLAMQLVAHVQNAFSIAISVKDIFDHPNFMQQVKLIGEKINSNKYQKIYKVPISEYYIATVSQTSLYFLNQTEEISHAIYNIPIILKLKRNISKDEIKKMFLRTIQRHEILRTNFDFVNGSVVQKISDRIDFSIQVFTYDNKKKDIFDKIYELSKKPINLKQIPLFKIYLFKTRNDYNFLLVNIHHILMDGFSIQILINELNAWYSNNELPPLPIQYKDFANYQNQLLKTRLSEESKNYWLKKLQGELPVLKLPADFTGNKQRDFRGGQITFKLTPNLKKQVKEFSKHFEFTISSILFTALSLVIYKYNVQEEQIFGMPVAGRNAIETHSLIGMFVNMLCIRLNPNPQLCIIDYLTMVQATLLSDLEHSYYPFESLIQVLKLPRETNSNPIFNIVFNYNTIQLSEEKSASIEFFKELNKIQYHIAKYDLTLTVNEICQDFDSELLLTFEYATLLFQYSTIKRLVKHFLNALTYVLQEPRNLIKQLNIVSSDEEYLLVNSWNNTKQNFPKTQCLQEMFEQQVSRNPSHIALIDKENKLSYKELNNQANQLAHYLCHYYFNLTNKQLEPNALIAICLPRGIHAIIAILAIIKAGAAYLPLDPEYPESRLDYMIQDSHSRVIISNGAIQKKIKINHAAVICIEEISELQEYSNKNPFSINSPKDLAYVIYTSGTTGRPKGVLIQHSNVINLLYAFEKVVNLSNKMNTTQFASISFDTFVIEVFSSLISGCCLHIVPPNIKHDGKLFIDFVKFHKINAILFLPPSFLAQLPLLRKKEIKVIVIGGEKGSKKLMDKWAKRTKLINGYGPTEATVYATVDNHQAKQSTVSIGRPIANVKIYILDSWLNICPIGVCGELYIGGEGVGLGYLNQPELTAERFIENPFRTNEDKTLNKNFKLYKTGDFARWLSDGKIEYIGRKDHQIKLRGFRIELTEIESILEKHVNIEQCLVLTCNEEDKQYIVAYYIATGLIKSNHLRDYLAVKLPSYMIPTFFIEIKEFPLTVNGKINYHKLPKPSLSNLINDNYLAPRSTLEKYLENIYSEILGVKKVGINTSFFALGGNSLSAMQLAQLVNKRLHLQLPLNLVFEYPTIMQLVKNISSLPNKKYKPICSVNKQSIVETSSMQRGIYLHQKSIGMKNPVYNIPILLKITDKSHIVKVKVRDIVTQLIARYDVFKTRFRIIEGKLVQEAIKPSIEINYISSQFKDKKSLDKIIADKLAIPFDLECEVLIKPYLFYSEDESILLLVTHHVVMDAMSIEIIIDDVRKLYNGDKRLRPYHLEYKDFLCFHHDLLKSNAIKKQKQFWLNELSGVLPKLNLPLDFERKDGDHLEGEHYTIDVARKLVNKIRKIINKINITEHTFLFSAFAILLCHSCQQEDILIGVPVYGRSHPDSKDIVGMFVNTLCVRIKQNFSMSILDYIKTVDRTLLNAYENQEYPLDLLMNDLSFPYDSTRHALFDVMFSYQIFNTKKDKHKKIKRYELDTDFLNTGSMFDLSFFVKRKKQEGLQFVVQFATELFNKATIVKLSKYYIKIIEWLLNNMGEQIKIRDLKLLSQKDKRKFSQNNSFILPLKMDVTHQPFESPRNKTEAILISIWQKVLEEKLISLNDNFFDIGGNSLTAIYMLELVAEEFSNKNISLIKFQSDPTIKNLSQQILEEVGSTNESNKHIILLQPKGTQKPIFILPGFIGFGSGYQALANIFGKNQPVYGIQMQGLFEGERPLHTIEDIARTNIQWIQQIQPKGPYKFIGHSFGALVAFEMTHQLEAMNVLTESLVLIDTGVHGLANNYERTKKDEYINILLSILHFLIPDDAVDKLSENNRQGFKKLYDKLYTLDNINNCLYYLIDYVKIYNIAIAYYQLRNIYELAKLNASISYVPLEPIKQNILLVRTKYIDNKIYSHHPKDVEKHCLGWSAFCSKVNIVTSQGNHISIVKDPYVKSLSYLFNLNSTTSLSKLI